MAETVVLVGLLVVAIAGVIVSLLLLILDR